MADIELSDALDELGVTVLSRRVHVTSAEILDLLNTPKEMIPAPGAGKLIVMVNMVLILTNSTINYTTTDGYYIKLAGADLIDLGGMISAATGNHAWVFGPPSAGVNNAISLVNQAAQLLFVDANPEEGDGDLTFEIAYRIVDIPL